jgi:integrase
VLGHLRVDEIQPRDVQRLVDELVAKQLSPATIDSAVTPLRAFYRRATTRGEARSNPALRIEKPGVRRKKIPVVEPRTVEAMLAALDWMDRVVWAVAFYAGLRRGELAALKWENVDLANGVVRVEHGWDVVEGEIAPKSSEGRRAVPLSALLRDYLDAHQHHAGRVFRSMRWVQGANARAREAWKPKGLPADLTLHSARHIYASMAIAAGINVKAVSVFMGHANIKVTLDIYGHLLPGSEAEAAGLFDAYLARSIGDPSVAPTVAHPTQSQALRG